MTFRIGMKVVCLGLRNQHSIGPAPQKGRVYTVRWVGQRTTDTEQCLMVEEMRSMHPCGVEWAWAASRFRPAVSPKSDISFTTGAPIDSERFDNRKRVLEPIPVDGWLS